MTYLVRVFTLFMALCLPATLSAQDDNSDRGFIQGLLEDALSGEGRSVRLVGFAGALSSRATIEEITVSDPDGVWLTISDVAMTWNRSALLRGAIDIEEISAGQIDLPRLPLPAEGEVPTPEASVPFALPDLPVSVVLEELSLARVNLGEGLFGEAASLSVEGSAELSGGEGQADLQVQRLDKGGEIAFRGAYSNDSRVLGLNLSVQEPEEGIAVHLLNLPGEPSLSLTLEGNSPIDNFEAQLQLATDGQERLAGSVILRADADTDARRFRVDIGGDIAPVVAPAYRDFLGDDVRLVAEVAQGADGRVALNELELSARALTLTGQAAIGADGWPESLDLQGRIAPPSGDEVVLPIAGGQTTVQGVTLSGTFDASAGNGWRLEARVAGLRQPAVEIDTLSLTGGGEISRLTNRVDGSLGLNASGLVLADAALAEAVGNSLRGALTFDWQPGSPIILDEIDLAGGDYGLTGAVTVSALDTLNPIVSPDITLRTDDLSRFAALSGLDLSGGAELAIDGGLEPLSGAFDLDVRGTTRELALGIPQADTLLAGVGSVALQARRNEEGLVVDPLRIATQAAEINGTARLGSGASTARLDAVINETGDVLPGLSGPTTLVATLGQTGDSYDVDADVTIPGAARVNYVGNIQTNLPEGTQISGRAEASVTRLGAFSELVGRDLNGAAELVIEGTGNPQAMTFDLTANGTTRDVEVQIPAVDSLLAGQSGIRFVGSRTETGRMEITQLQIDGAADASFAGVVLGDSLETLDVDGRLTASVPDLARFSGVTGRQMSGSASVDLTVDGPVMQGPLTVAGNATAQDAVLGLETIDPVLRGSTRIDVDAARAEDGTITITRLQTQGAANATLVGTVAGYEMGEPFDLNALDLDARLVAAVDDLSRFSGLAGRRLAGAATLDVTADGALMQGPLAVALTASMQDVVLSLPQVDPVLRGATSVVLDAQRDAAGTITVARLETTGAANASFIGTVAGFDPQAPGDLDDLAVDGRLTADVPNLSRFSGLAGRDLAGSATADVTAQGQVLDGPLSVEAIATARNVAIGMGQVDSLLGGETRIDLKGSRDAAGVYTLERLQTSGAVNATYNGTLQVAEGDAVLDGSLNGDIPALSALSGLAGRRLGGSVRFDADVEGQALNGPLSLRADVTAQNLVTSVETADRLLRGTTTLNLQAARDASGLLRIERGVLDASGIDATVSGQYASSSANVTLDVSVPNVGLIVPDLQGAGTVRGTVSHSGGPWQVNLTGTGPGGIGATARGSIAQDFGSANLSLNGSAPLALANEQIAPQVITGVLNFDVGVNGPLALSSVSGTVSTNGARLAVPSASLIIDGLTGEVRLSGGSAQVALGGTLSTGGQVRVSGPITLSPTFNANLTVQLIEAVLRQADLLETTANGTVTVNGALTGGAQIGGVINLGQVEVRIPNLGASYSALDGLRHINPPADVQRTLAFAGLNASGRESTGAGGGTAVAYPINLTVNAPNQIFVRGRGLDAELGGSLLLTGTTANLVPQGQFDLIRGRLDLLGRRLDLTDGSVSLRGSFDPYISFGASTQVEDTTITIRIEGFASEPDLRVTSDPELPEDEALSFFLFGRSVTNLSPLQAVQLAAAVRTLSGQGGLGLTENLRSGLGVDNLDIGTDAEGNAQATVGKYISDNIYTDVTVGGDGTSQINLNLQVNPNVTVRGRVGSDGDTGLGVFFEKDY